MPQWEHINAKIDTDYTDLKKSESTNILAIQVREHLNNKYQNHIMMFTDGSVLGSLDSRAGFVIPELKVQKSFYLGKGISIFTSELYAILIIMVLNYICNIQLAIYKPMDKLIDTCMWINLSKTIDATVWLYYIYISIYVSVCICVIMCLFRTRSPPGSRLLAPGVLKPSCSTPFTLFLRQASVYRSFQLYCIPKILFTIPLFSAPFLQLIST